MMSSSEFNKNFLEVTGLLGKYNIDLEEDIKLELKEVLTLEALSIYYRGCKVGHLIEYDFIRTTGADGHTRINKNIACNHLKSITIKLLGYILKQAKEAKDNEEINDIW